jgi:hypothetical protein
MLNIQRSVNDKHVLFLLSGRIEADDLPGLEAVIAAEVGSAALDLGEVQLAGQEAILFLARCEAAGTKLLNCPAYIREWITRESSGS